MTEQAFFEAPEWTVADAHLQQAIGSGRQSETEGLSLQLTQRAQASNPAQRTMLPLELSLNGQSVWIWFDEVALLEWLEPILPTPDFSVLDEGLREAAAAWTLAPWLDWCVQHGLVPPSIKALGAPASPPARSDQREYAADMVLSLVSSKDLRWLDLHLDAFPLTWLSALAKCMTASPHQPTEQHTVISACAAFAHLSVAQLTALKVGDVVMASWQAPLKNASLLLVLDRLLVQICRLDENHIQIERIMEPLGEENHFMTDTPEVAAHAPLAEEVQPVAEDNLTLGKVAASLPLTLVFEIGQMTVSLAALSQLKEGDVLEADLKTTPEIGIRTQGRLIATASLVRIGERLGAKITRLLAPEETR
ncbi:FliM/FliN family flagellar motor switch protein [Mycoavidus sp. B2-EB]|uniref:FliM/FliN family flagellar motor switch protein n=1 Tax=Mycoavidus sp. B2-EB TaxID=2651972 RepID=UPI00162A55B5|nr:FliM/FliN family flagellar motor switch protein [Mycoavidus sp. B2-EB]BBO59082.1 type III secretion protein [Mycoavidus sp. B2-EB]